MQSIQILKLSNAHRLRPVEVQAEWDPEASVWLATSDEVPGLVTEAETLEALEAKLKVMVPELIDANV